MRPVHDFSVGSQYKLIPSVVNDVEVTPEKFLEKGDVSYRSATHIDISNAKHTNLNLS